MAEIKIFWTKIAIAQRNQIFHYWNNRNKSTAYSIKLNKRIKEKVSLLKTNPEMGIVTEFENTRAIFLGHYSILYKRINEDIYIKAVWDNRQNPAKLFEILK